MRILVTGSTGYIGRHLLPLLQDHEVLCLSRVARPPEGCPGVRMACGDLNAPESYYSKLVQFSPQCCVHLAWEGLPDYSFGRCLGNLIAGCRLFENLERVGCSTVVAAGTCWEYGGLNGAVAEDRCGSDVNLVASFKRALHSIGQAMFSKAGIRFVWARPFFIYGAGQRPGSLIPSCYRSFKNGNRPEIANPSAINDFIHVADVADAIRAFIQCEDVRGVYNIGSGEPAPVWQVVNRVAAQLELPPIYSDMPASGTGFWADIGKAQSLGWRPQRSLSAGIAETVEALELES